MPSRSLERVLGAVALITGLALGAAACGSQAAGPSAGGPAASTASASPTAPGTCAGNAKPAPSGSTLTLGSRDNGSTFCLRMGQQVLVYLHGSPAHMWAPVRSDSSALRPSPNGSFTLMRGVTGAAFVATRPSTVHLTSARPACIGKPVRCDAMIAFHVTIVIAVPAT